MLAPCGDLLEVRHVVLRVAQALEIDAARVLVDEVVDLLGMVRIEEADLDPHLLERLREERPRSAVQARRRDEVLSGVADREERRGDGGLPRCEAERRGAAVHRTEPLLEDVVRRVHEPAVDVSELGEPEEVRRVLRVVEDVRRGRIDRHRPRIRRRIGLLPCMHRHRTEPMLLFVTHRGVSLESLEALGKGIRAPGLWCAALNGRSRSDRQRALRA